MKPMLIAIALALACGGAFAQTSGTRLGVAADDKKQVQKDRKQVHKDKERVKKDRAGKAAASRP